MSDIKRYELGFDFQAKPLMVPDPRGHWVRLGDHIDEIDDLEDKIYDLEDDIVNLKNEVEDLKHQLAQAEIKVWY